MLLRSAELRLPSNRDRTGNTGTGAHECEVLMRAQAYGQRAKPPSWKKSVGPASSRGNRLPAVACSPDAILYAIASHWAARRAESVNLHLTGCASNRTIPGPIAAQTRQTNINGNMADFSVLAIVLGAVVGLILALTGAGGGILAVPLLTFGMHLPIVQSGPIGLIAVGLASAFGAALGLREGIVQYRAAASIGLVGMALAPLGVRLAAIAPNGPLTIAFAFVLAFVALRMLRASLRTAAAGHLWQGRPRPCMVDPATGRLRWNLRCARALAGTGALSGVLSGLLGVGGGFVIVPALTRFTNLSSRSIIASSLATIALVSVGGVGAAALQGSVVWPIALPFSAGAVLALLGGRVAAARLNGARLQQAFAVTSLLVSILMVCKGLGWLPA